MSVRGRALATVVAASALALVAPTAASAAEQHGNNNMVYKVTIINITSGQPNSPMVVTTHRGRHAFWQVGSKATNGLRQIAENGLPQDAVAELGAARRVSDVQAAEGPSVPAGTPGAEAGLPDRRTITVEAGPGARFLSTATMLVCTNDGFTGVDSLRLPRRVGETATAATVAYDAGTEINTERLGDIVPPCQAAIGVTDPNNPGTEMSNPALAEGGVIAMHQNIMGKDDGSGDVFLDPKIHGWPEPVGVVLVERVS